MKINVINNSYRQSFKGTFFYSADEHFRNANIARGLTTVENFASKRADKNLPVFYLNGGDFTSSAGSCDETAKIYNTFMTTNPDITPIFALGNMETFAIRRGLSDFNAKIAKMAKGVQNISFLFAPKKTFEKTLQEGERAPDYVKPYVILKDKVKTEDGYRTQNGAVIATGSDEISSTEAQKAELAQTIGKLAQEPEKIDKVFLISHNILDDDFNIFIHNKLKEAGLSLDLVLMGHSHKVYETKVPGTDIKVISPPPNGLGFVEIETRENEVLVSKIPEMPLAVDGSPDLYNYYQETCLQNGQPAMFTLSGKIPLDKMSSKYEVSGMDHHIKLAPHQVPKLRVTNRKAPSSTTQLGTALANGVRDITNADFAALYGLHIRTPLMPSEDRQVSINDVGNTFQDNFNLWLIKLNPEQLVEMFEKALDKQGQGSDNNHFLEYSDNVEITRDPSKELGEWGKIRQIRVKRDNETIELFDKFGKIKKQDIEFTVGTCAYMPSPQANKIKMKDGFRVCEKTDSTFLDALTLELEKISNGSKNVSCAKMIDT